jgi:adenylate kinase
LGRRVVVVGVPGVGKTTVVTEAVRLLKGAGRDAEIAVFGTFMLEEASKLGIRHRDDMRRLPIEAQREIQSKAARMIAQISTEVVFVDTHAFIRTPSGLWPGLPRHVLEELQPHLFAVVEATPEEILNRRSRDAGRRRDLVDTRGVEEELVMTRAFIAAASVLTGAPTLTVLNREGRAGEAATQIVEAIGGL